MEDIGHNSSDDDTAAAGDDIMNERKEDQQQQQSLLLSPQRLRRRRRRKVVSFPSELTTSIYEIPKRTVEENTELFYNTDDFMKFQTNEQRRYDKMMAKRTQQLVEEAMKDQLHAAYERNATPEEIDAIMPQTTEEIFNLIGGFEALNIPKPPPVVVQNEQPIPSSSSAAAASNTNLSDQPSVRDDTKSPPPVEEDTTKSVGSGQTNSTRVQKQNQNNDISFDDDEQTQAQQSQQQRKFHLGNDDPTVELPIFDLLEKNDDINDVLGTSFSSHVHVDDLIPLSPKQSSPTVSSLPSPQSINNIKPINMTTLP
jgi:hypothetical protein